MHGRSHDGIVFPECSLLVCWRPDKCEASCGGVGHKCGGLCMYFFIVSICVGVIYVLVCAT